MKSLFMYFGHEVTLTDTDGVEWHGYARAYTSSIDSENGEEEIVLRTTDGLIGFSASEIKNIGFVEEKDDE